MIINVTGFGWSGATAVRDILKEFEETSHFPKEFSLSYDPNGFLDLYHKLTKEWNFLQVDKAIKDHVKYFKQISGKKNFINRYGLNLDESFQVDSKKIHAEFLREIIDFRYTLNSRVNYLYLNTWDKIIFRLLVRTDYFHNKTFFSSSTEEEFLNALVNFHNKLFWKNTDNNKITLLEKAIPANNIHTCSTFFSNLKIIMVDRDPRDTFVQMSNGKSVFWGNNSNINETEVLKYSYWKKKMYETSKFDDLNHGEVVPLKNGNELMKLDFEQLIFNYNHCLNLIMDFCGVQKHNQKFKFFDPKKSAENVGVYKYYPNQNHIRIIENQLNL